jgi:hypothetical protein
MKRFRLLSDLPRATRGSFAFAKGLVPREIPMPVEGYTLDYVTADEDDFDSYHFHITVSHERVAKLVTMLFRLLGTEVFAILEIGSRDAYRAVDVWMSPEPIPLRDFRRTWEEYAEFLLEDGTISAGATSEEPPFEVFVDHWKGISIHAPLNFRDHVERILHAYGLSEYPEPWLPETGGDEDLMETRPVLDLSDPDLPDVEDVLLDLRDDWQLELNIDPDVNRDESGRDLGRTLWFAMVLVESREHRGEGAYAMIWLTAESLAMAEEMVVLEIERHERWSFLRIYSMDRVAFDERPEELADLPPRPTTSEILDVDFEPWVGGGPGPAEELGRGE